VTHVRDQVMGMFDDGKQFAVVPPYQAPIYGCPQAGKENFILGTSAEVVGLTFDSAIKQVLTADGRAIPTHRDKRQVCSTQAIVIPPGYPPIAGTTPLGKAYNAWLALNPSGLRDEQMESGAPTHYDPLTLCEYMGGSGRSALPYSQRTTSPLHTSTKMTWLDLLALRTDSPCSAAHGSLNSVVHDLGNEDSFFRNALGTDVGIAAPPCGSSSQANLRKSKSTTADAADLLIECVSLGLHAGHKVFVCENVSDALSVQHGAITARLAALASEHTYVMHLSLRHGPYQAQWLPGSLTPRVARVWPRPLCGSTIHR
jgi:hypothetical protein